jgi:hypothetical protein
MGYWKFRQPAGPAANRHAAAVPGRIPSHLCLWLDLRKRGGSQEEIADV